MKVRSGRMNGPAVGLTAQGDFNLSNGAHDFAGTVIPAYELNSLFSHIPIIGRILTGRRGEGLLGVGYRLFGESGRSNIIINPLSLFTPGFSGAYLNWALACPIRIRKKIWHCRRAAIPARMIR